MPAVSTLGLVAAVSEAGALGMLPGTMMAPADLDRSCAELSSRTSGPFGVNFLMPFLDPDAVAVAARGARVVEFFYDEPRGDLIEMVHGHGAVAGWQVGSLAEARAAHKAGCDYVIAQGTEAGGHVRGSRALRDLLASVVGALDLPVLASGGIATGKAVAGVLSAGAAGVRVGTRFLASEESDAHVDYVEAVVGAQAGETCLTEAFHIEWPNAPHRVLRSAVVAAEAAPDGVIGETSVGEQSVPVERFSVLPPSADATGRVDVMALYAGESVTDIHDVRRAAQIVADLTSELDHCD